MEALIRWDHPELGMIPLDDFGTDYSSLAYLRQLPVHEIAWFEDRARDRMGASASHAAS